MEKPILFNTEMVKAILEGRKTCTRRIIKRSPSNDDQCGYGFWKQFNERDNTWYVKDYTHSCTWWPLKEYIKKFQKYHVGDILYVRETWTTIDNFKNYADIEMDESLKYLYKCDDTGKEHVFIDIGVKKWKPSIHMPKVAARIFLEVTNVRIERLNTIEYEDVLREGIKYDCDCWTKQFHALWDSTIKKDKLDKYGFNANPYVYVIDFKKIDRRKVQNE